MTETRVWMCCLSALSRCLMSVSWYHPHRFRYHTGGVLAFLWGIWVVNWRNRPERWASWSFSSEIVTAMEFCSSVLIFKEESTRNYIPCGRYFIGVVHYSNMRRFPGEDTVLNRSTGAQVKQGLGLRRGDLMCSLVQSLASLFLLTRMCVGQAGIPIRKAALFRFSCAFLNLARSSDAQVRLRVQ